MGPPEMEGLNRHNVRRPADRNNPSSLPPPIIPPVRPGIGSPRWSVMIPVYNCAHLLPNTLQSVLCQAPGKDKMQIEVVDDCSTADSPEEVVRSIGGDRVDYFRKTSNEGAIANYNTCIQRSRGEFVHILHGDDWILPGFYSEIESLIAKYPEASLFGTRSFFADDEGFLTGVSRRFKPLETPARGPVYLDQDASVQCAGMVMKRDFYETTGGFMENLPHTADVEMWTRAFHLGAGVLSPEVLSVYRVFEGNHTSRLVRSAENLKDMARLYRALGEKVPGYDYPRSRSFLQRYAIQQFVTSCDRKDKGAADAAGRFYLEHATTGEKFWFWRWLMRRRLRAWKSDMIHRMRKAT
jgi:glycosyltransferase involved in cell wall biosynthesis